MSTAWIAGAGLVLLGACTGNITLTPKPWTGDAGAPDAGLAGAGGAGRGGAGGAAGSSGSTSAAGSGGDAGREDVSSSEPSAEPASGPRDTLYVQGGTLRDRCGEKLVLRGINHPTMFIDREGKALPEIAKTGANAVRLFWYAKKGVAISEADAAISRAIAEHMVPILEMHDSTCEW